MLYTTQKKKIIALNSPSHSDFIKKITRERCEIYSFGGGGGFFLREGEFRIKIKNYHTKKRKEETYIKFVT